MRPEWLAYEYAAALFTLAQESKSESSVYDELVSASEISVLDKRIINFIQSPAVSIKEKSDFVKNIFPVKKLMRNFLELTIERKVFHLLPMIATQYKKLLEEALGQEPVTIVSAVPLDQTKQTVIKEKLRAMLKKTILPEFAVDPGLVAGVVIRYRDQVLDGSLKTQFQVLKEDLLKE